MGDSLSFWARTPRIQATVKAAAIVVRRGVSWGMSYNLLPMSRVSTPLPDRALELESGRFERSSQERSMDVIEKSQVHPRIAIGP